MARGRMLNRSVSASLKFHLLPDDTCRLLASWIIPYLDFRGVFHGDAVMVKSYVFPRRGDITNEQVEDCLKAMEDIGLIYRFEAKGDVWQCWPGFADNQGGLRADRESTNYPAPPDYIPPTPKPKPTDSPQDNSELPAPIPQETGDNPAESQQDDAEMTAEGKLTEVLTEKKLSEERSGGEKPPPPPPPKSRKKPKKPIPPAVTVFRDAAHRFPAKSWWGKVVAAVGEAEADLAFWGRVVENYVGCGWNPVNVKTMLEFYRRREIPTVGKQRKKQLGQFTDIELEKARQASLAEDPIDVVAFLGEGA